MGEYLTLEEAADRLGVEYKTVYRLVRSGEIPAGKIGRIYRVREEDLGTYFDRQKQAMADETQRGLTPLEGLQCGSCATAIVSELSIAGRCEQDGCDLPICQACWTIKKIRHCQPHTEASPEPAPKAAVPKFGVGETTEEIIERLRTQGRPVVSPHRARLMEESFLRVFAQHLEDVETLPEPVSGVTVELRKARVKHEILGASTASMPGNLVSRFTLRAGGWGKPKACLVLEARFLCDLEALQGKGYWAEPIGAEQAEAVFAELTREKGLDGCFRVVVIGSPTGFARAATKRVADAKAKAFRDKKVAVVLADLHGDRVFLDAADKRLWPFWPVVSPADFEQKVDECTEAIRAAVDRKGSIAVADVARECSGDPSWARVAMRRLQEDGQYVVDELPDTGLVISRPLV